MAFDPRGFLDTAKHLDNSTVGEAGWRSSISRAYYAVHGHIHLNTDRGVSSFSGQKKNRHEELIYFYKQSTGIRQKIGIQLEQLFKQRISADYVYDKPIQRSFCNTRCRDCRFSGSRTNRGVANAKALSAQGMVMQGSKLGNGFKWSTIKNTINYEQERDRQRIYETNIRSEHAINKLRADNDNKHAQRDTANPQGSAIKYGQLPDSAQANRLYIFSPSFAAGIVKHANGLSEHETGRVINTVPEISKSISFASLLDSHNRGRDLGPAYQSPADDGMKKKRKKKKRKGLRL